MNQHLTSCLTGHDKVTSPVPVCALGFFRNPLPITQIFFLRIRKKIYRYQAFYIKISPSSSRLGTKRDDVGVFSQMVLGCLR